MNNTRLEGALSSVTRVTSSLWDDIQSGNLTLDQIREKHEELIEMAMETVDVATKLPDVDLVVERNDLGEILVHSKGVTLDWVFIDRSEEFDPRDVFESQPFTSYPELVETLTVADVVGTL